MTLYFLIFFNKELENKRYHTSLDRGVNMILSIPKSLHLVHILIHIKYYRSNSV